MEIKVRSSLYQSVTIQDGGTTLDTGLLNAEESEEMAIQFLDAAYELIDVIRFISLLEDRYTLVVKDGA